LVKQKGIGRGTYCTIRQIAAQMRCKIRAIEFLKEHKKIKKIGTATIYYWQIESLFVKLCHTQNIKNFGNTLSSSCYQKRNYYDHLFEDKNNFR